MKKVLLIGDSCIDEYVYGHCSRLSPEAPVPVLNFAKREFKPGMAGNVHENLKAFGVKVKFVTNKEKIIKTRYVDDRYNQQILRVDKDDRSSPMKGSLNTKGYDAVVISDYNKGFITEKKLLEIVKSFNGPIFLDTKKRVIPDKKNCFVKINESEFNELEKSPKNVIVTLGGRGARYKGTVYPIEKVSVFDVGGAGDTFLAALAYFYLLFNSIEKAIPYANKASSIVVQHRGTYALNKKDVRSLLKD